MKQLIKDVVAVVIGTLIGVFIALSLMRLVEITPPTHKESVLQATEQNNKKCDDLMALITEFMK